MRLNIYVPGKQGKKVSAANKKVIKGVKIYQKENKKVILYGLKKTPEELQALRKNRSSVIEDKKKNGKKYICRGYTKHY